MDEEPSKAALCITTYTILCAPILCSSCFMLLLGCLMAAASQALSATRIILASSGLR
jgi:hypothetical protein